METPPRSRKDDYLANTLWELENVYLDNDVVFLLGDVLHRPTLTTRAENIIIRFIKKQVGLGKRTFTIVGNHDIYNMTLVSLEDSKLAVFDEIGLLPIIHDSIQFEGLKVDVIPMSRTVTVPTATKKGSILVGHVFFESGMDPKFSVTREQLFGKGYSYVILGHDHEPHKTVEILDEPSGTHCKVIRPGSLARHTSHKYNLERDLAYVQVVADDSGLKSIAIKPIPTVPARECFAEECFTKLEPSSMPTNFIHNITEMLNAFTHVSNKEGKMTLAQALARVETPSNIVSYLRSKHEQLSIPFI